MIAALPNGNKSLSSLIVSKRRRESPIVDSTGLTLVHKNGFTEEMWLELIVKRMVSKMLQEGKFLFSSAALRPHGLEV